MKKTFVTLALGLSLLGFSSQSQAANLVTNGDFEKGNTNIFSDYSFSNDIMPETTYNIVDNPIKSHPFSESFGDHTTGNGLMMAINAATYPNKTVWGQNINVNKSTTYDFSGWVSNWTSYSPASLDISINGVSLGIFNPSTATGTWEKFTKSWNSGNNSIANLKIVDLNTAAGGNDFALDDIAFSPVPEPSSMVLGLMGLGSMLGFRRKRAIA